MVDSKFFQNGVARAQQSIMNKMVAAGLKVENDQNEYMSLNGKQYIKYGKSWFLGDKRITNPALLADLEKEYLRQFKSV